MAGVRGRTTMRDDEDPATATLPAVVAAPSALSPTAPATPAGTPSRLNRTLHSLRQPFRTVSPFHISAIKRTGSNKSTASESEVTRDDLTMRKKNKKQRGETASDASGASKSTDNSPSVGKKKKEGGGFVRRLGSLTRRRVGEGSSTTASPPSTEPASDREPFTDKEPASPESPASPIAVEHPVNIRPFTKAAWKRKSIELEMEKPIEEPSPESALRRRIAFVTQASACMSEDQDESEGGERGDAEVGSLEDVVALARVRLAPAAATPSTHSQDIDTEEEGFADAMPPYGDLLEPEPDAGDGSKLTAETTASTAAPVEPVSSRGACAQACGRASGQQSGIGCARAMTFEEAADESYLTVCECCGFSSETAVLFPVRYLSR